MLTTAANCAVSSSSREASPWTGAGGRQRRPGWRLGHHHAPGAHHPCVAVRARPPPAHARARCGTWPHPAPVVSSQCRPRSRLGAGGHQGGAAHAGGARAVLRRQRAAPDARAQRHRHQLHRARRPAGLAGRHVGWAGRWHRKGLCHVQGGGRRRLRSARRRGSSRRPAAAPVHVGESEEWLRSRQHDVQAHAAQMLDYDWCANRCAGCAPRRDPAPRIPAGSAAGKHRCRRGADVAGACRRTFTTSYAGDVSRGSSSADGAAETASAAGGAGGGAPPSPRWEPSSAQIPRALLTARDPILYWDELPLCESELDDHGASRVSVKARRRRGGKAPVRPDTGRGQGVGGWAGRWRACPAASAAWHASRLPQLVAARSRLAGVAARPSAAAGARDAALLVRAAALLAAGGPRDGAAA